MRGHVIELSHAELDEDRKVTADRVCLIDPQVSAYMLKADGSKVFDVAGGITQSIMEQMVLFAVQDFMVIGVNRNETFNCGLCDKEHNADLRVGGMTDMEQYYIASEFVKIKE